MKMYSMDVIKDITALLKGLNPSQSEIGIPEKEAEDILLYETSITKTVLYRDNPLITPETINRIMSLAKRRAAQEPIQYIFGQTQFLNLTINVGKGVLIPRPETETVTITAIDLIKKGYNPSIKKMSILDLCTGSGCIALSIAKEFPEIKVIGTDVSSDALKYAAINASDNNIDNVVFIQSSLFDDINGLTFDLIISNPPYIKTDVIDTIERDIRLYEPINALDGGADGLYFYRKILNQASQFLKPNGIIIFEISEDMRNEITDIAKNARFRQIKILKDLNNKDRIAIIHE